ncbi:MAG: nicotinate phosphoribosyltransferase, partial [Desulfitobacterium hafniense]
MQDVALLTDLYQLTMMQGYYQNGYENKEAVFDLYFRKIPSGGGYVIAA